MLCLVEYLLCNSEGQALACGMFVYLFVSSSTTVDDAFKWLDRHIRPSIADNYEYVVVDVVIIFVVVVELQQTPKDDPQARELRESCARAARERRRVSHSWCMVVVSHGYGGGSDGGCVW